MAHRIISYGQPKILCFSLDLALQSMAITSFPIMTKLIGLIKMYHNQLLSVLVSSIGVFNDLATFVRTYSLLEWKALSIDS